MTLIWKKNCSYYKHNVAYSQDWRLFTYLDWWGSKRFCSHKFGEFFKSIREDQHLRKFAKSLYIFQTTPDEVEKYAQSNSSDNCVHHYNVEILNIFDPELQLISSKPMIKSKRKEALSDLKKLKFGEY